MMEDDVVIVESDEDRDPEPIDLHGAPQQSASEDERNEGNGSDRSSPDLFGDEEAGNAGEPPSDTEMVVETENEGIDPLQHLTIPRPDTPIPPADSPVVVEEQGAEEMGEEGDEGVAGEQQPGGEQEETAAAVGQESGDETSSDAAQPAPANSSLSEFKTPKKLKVPSPKKYSPCKDDDSECCPICFEQWTNSGRHRLASLKCGHLFGASCIERWLRGQGQGSKCPQCNSKANRKDIRMIYAKAIKTQDTTERDRALEELEREKEARRKAELETAQARLRYQMAVDECNRLKQEVERTRHQLQTVRSQGGQPGNLPASSQQVGVNNGPLYVQHTNIKVWEAGGCRVMAFCNHLATLVVSQPSASPLFPGFGVKKINALDLKTAQYVSVHSKMIRDMAFNPASPDGVLLSCGMDKQVKMTSMLSNAAIQTYQCSLPVWSCAWCADNRNYFYAGVQNGTVLVFDVRNTSEHVKELNKEGSRSPVVSMQYVPKDPGSTFRPGGLIVGQLDHCVFYEHKTDGEYKVHALPVEGSLTSLSMEESTRHILTSFRPTAKNPGVRHQMYELSCSNLSADPTVIDNMCTCNQVETFHGGRTQKLLSRSRLYCQPRSEGKLLVAAGDEAMQAVHVWDASNGQLRQKIPVGGPPVDLCPFKVNDQDFLACLTEKYVKVFKWS